MTERTRWLNKKAISLCCKYFKPGEETLSANTGGMDAAIKTNSIIEIMKEHVFSFAFVIPFFLFRDL